MDLAERQIQGAGPEQAPADSHDSSAALQGRSRELLQLFQALSPETTNPLKDLQERIKALKEEMKRLLGPITPIF